MIRTGKMVQLSAVVLEKYQDPLTKRLIQLGLLDFISVKELAPTLTRSLTEVKQRVPLSKVKDLRKKLESIMVSGKIDFPEIPELAEKIAQSADFEAIADEVKKLDGAITLLRTQQREVQGDLLRLKEIESQVQMALHAKNRAKKGSENLYAAHLVVRSGVLTGNKAYLLEKLRAYPAVLLKSDENIFYCVHLKRDILQMDTVFAQGGWKEDQVLMGDISITQELSVLFSIRLDELKETQDNLKFQLEERLSKDSVHIQGLWQDLRIIETYSSIQQKYNRTERTFIFSGWIAEKKTKILSDAIWEVCQGDCYIELISAEEAKEEEGIEAPVLLETPRFLKPFEKLITDFSVPAYGTLNPAYIVAITFLLMFGLMFGDVGHGFVISSAGLLGMIIGKKRKKPNSLFNLMFYCGISAMFFGVLFGSYFGFSLLPALWFNYHGAVVGAHASGPIQSIMQILALSTWLGVGIISLGLLFNFYNCIAQKKWLVLFTEKNGLAGAILYWLGVYLGYLYMTQNSFSSAPLWLVIPCLVVSLLLFLIRLIFHSIHEEGRFKILKLPMIFMELIIEMLEFFSSYLANTLSFLRVAGLGIAHVSLMQAFFSLADLFGQGSVGSAIGYWSIILLGNVLVITLEGLSAWIQTLRLHYYEFFNKFLVGGGIAFRPINLSDKRD